MGEGADGRKVLIFGLSHANLDRLRAEEPIMIDSQQLGWDNGPNVIICAGKTEDTLRADLGSVNFSLKKGFLWKREGQ